MHRLQHSKSTSDLEIKTSLSLFFSPKIPRITTHQHSPSSRASDSITTYPICQQNTLQSPLKISIWNAEITSTILSLCDFQCFKILRLVSKIFYLTSTITTDLPSPLANKAIISFPYFQLSSKLQDSTDFNGKFAFAKDHNLEQHIIVSVYDLYHTPAKFTCFPKNKFKLILEINLLTELYQLSYLINNCIKHCAHFISMINELKFTQINTKNNSSPHNLSHANHSPSIDSLLTTITQNLDYFSNLSTLSISDIGKNCIRTLPAFNTLTSLSIGTIWPGATFKLTASFDQLTTLSIKKISKNATLEILVSLPNLSSLYIGMIAAEAILMLPDSLPNLSSIRIQEHLAILTISNGLTKLAFTKPIHNPLINDLLQFINEGIGKPHT